MKKPSRLGRWISNILTFICIAVVSVSIYFLLVRFGYLAPLQSGIVALTTFFGLCVLQRQVDLVRDIKALKSLDWANIVGDDPDGELAVRVDELSRKIDAVSASSQTESGNLNNSLGEKLSELEQRLTALEQSTAPAEYNSSEPDIATEVAPSITTPTKLNTDVVTVSESGMPSANMKPFISATTLDGVAGFDEKKKPRKINLQAAVGAENLNMHLQPIVELPDRKPAYFDAFMRLKDDDGDFLQQKEFLELIDEGGLAAMIDQKVVHSSVRMLIKLDALKKRSGVFCNLSSTTLGNPNAMKEITKVLQSNKKLGKSLFIEIRQRDFSMLKAKQIESLANIVDLGFTLSLSHVLDYKLDVAKLARLGFEFVKTPTSILLHANIDGGADGIHPSALSSALEENGISLIGTGIERESEAIGLIDYDVSFGQGLLFAPPRPVKSELVEAASTAKKRAKKTTA